LVVGAGAAGIAAAVAASKNGRSVVVVERRDFSGGNATAAEVGTVCGLYHNNFGEPEFLVRGFAREFAEKLQSLSGTMPLSTKDGLHYLPYHVPEFARLGREYLSENGITALFNHQVQKAVVHQSRIVTVEIRANESFNIVPSAVVDCSGNSVVARLANLPLISEPEYQSAAQVFSLKGIEEDREDRLSLLLIKAMAKAGDEISINGHLPKLYLVPGSLKNGFASFKIALPFTITEGSEWDAQIAEKAKALVSLMTAHLIKELASFKHAESDHIAASPGFRVASRTRGKYMLTGNEVKNCTHFNEGIARCSWPIEEWDANGNANLQYLPEYGYYEIPQGSLMAVTTENLFMAGRNISADKEAIASARVMGICLQTGFAAGLLAAANASGMLPSQALQIIQREQMAYL